MRTISFEKSIYKICSSASCTVATPINSIDVLCLNFLRFWIGHTIFLKPNFSASAIRRSRCEILRTSPDNPTSPQITVVVVHYRVVRFRRRRRRHRRHRRHRRRRRLSRQSYC